MVQRRTEGMHRDAMVRTPQVRARPILLPQIKVPTDAELGITLKPAKGPFRVKKDLFSAHIPRPKDILSAAVMHKVLCDMRPTARDVPFEVDTISPAVYDRVTFCHDPRDIQMIRNVKYESFTPPFTDLTILNWADECNMEMLEFLFSHSSSLPLLGLLLTRAVTSGCRPLYELLRSDPKFIPSLKSTWAITDSARPLQVVTFAVLFGHYDMAREILQIAPLYTNAWPTISSDEMALFRQYSTDEYRSMFEVEANGFLERLRDDCKKDPFSTYLCYKLYGQYADVATTEPAKMCEEVFLMVLKKLGHEQKNEWLGTVCDVRKLRLLVATGVPVEVHHVLKQLETCGVGILELMKDRQFKDTPDHALLRALLLHARDNFNEKWADNVKKAINFLLKSESVPRQDLMAILKEFRFQVFKKTSGDLFVPGRLNHGPGMMVLQTNDRTQLYCKVNYLKVFVKSPEFRKKLAHQVLKFSADALAYVWQLDFSPAAIMTREIRVRQRYG